MELHIQKHHKNKFYFQHSYSRISNYSRGGVLKFTNEAYQSDSNLIILNISNMCYKEVYDKYCRYYQV
jgi:hypothetical protein